MRHLVIILAFVCPGIAEGRADSREIQPTNRVVMATAAKLLAMCEHSDRACEGYIAATMDATNNTPYSIPRIVDPGKPVALAQVCTLKTDMLEQAKINVVAFLKRHPEYLEYQASGVVATALDEAYPCAAAGMK